MALKRYTNDEDMLKDKLIDECNFTWLRFQIPLKLSATAKFGRVLKRMNTTGRDVFAWLHDERLAYLARDLSGGLHLYPIEAWLSFSDDVKREVLQGTGPGMPTTFREPGRPRKEPSKLSHVAPQEPQSVSPQPVHRSPDQSRLDAINEQMRQMVKDKGLPSI